MSREGGAEMNYAEGEINPILKEVFMFRPLAHHKDMLRYADGKWLPDDGQPDLAFVYYDDYPACEYVSMPYYTNLLWKWWEKAERRMIWHYCTTNNKDWADYRFGKRDNHPNEIASRTGMRKCCSLYGCANGRSIDIDQGNDYINQGRLIIQSSGGPVIEPENLICFLCLNNGYGHRRQELLSERSQLELGKELYKKQIAEYKKQIAESEIDLLDARAALGCTDNELTKLEVALAKAEGLQEK